MICPPLCFPLWSCLLCMMLPLPPSATTTWGLLIFLRHSGYTPTSGPLHLLFFLFPDIWSAFHILQVITQFTFSGSLSWPSIIVSIPSYWHFNLSPLLFFFLLIFTTDRLYIWLFQPCLLCLPRWDIKSVRTWYFTLFFSLSQCPAECLAQKVS